MQRNRPPSAQAIRVLRALAADPSRWRYGYDLVTEVGLKLADTPDGSPLALRPTVCSRSGRCVMTSSVLVPMEPVEPSTTTRRGEGTLADKKHSVAGQPRRGQTS